MQYAYSLIIETLSFGDDNMRNKIHKKSLKISKGYSESLHRRRTDNTMANRKRTKGQTTIYKTQHRKLKIYQILKSVKLYIIPIVSPHSDYTLYRDF